MGFDVIGKNPTSEVGSYFRNNVWWWHPLADYCIRVAPDICAKCTYWHSNDGDGLGLCDSVKLADALDAEIASGACARFSRVYAKAQKALPRETCSFCGGSGIRTDAVGIEGGWPDRIVTVEKGDEPNNPRAGQKGSCNSCKGWGTRKSFSYPFSVENVREFSKFLRDSGGFEIG
jgi:hypothetical protein